MLTIRQLLVASGQNTGDLHTNTLPRQFGGGSLSLRSAIALYEKQRRTYFVSLITPNIILSNDVQTFDDLIRLSSDFHGQMNRDEVVALTTNLANYGVMVRLVDKNFRHAALIGTVSSLTSVPSTIVDEQNFTQIRDKYAGAEAIGGGIGIVGTVIIAFALAPTAVGISATAAPTVLFVGAAVAGVGVGVVFGAGIMDILHDSSPGPEKDSSDKTKSELDSSDGLPDDSGDQDTIEIPNAVAIGDPPQGFDVDNLLTDLSDFSLDLILSDIPVGWDPDTGTGIPLGGTDLGGQDGGDGPAINVPV